MIEKKGYCTLCRSRCGTINRVEGDSLVAVRPDPSHPTGEAMCMKGRAAPELVHSPHRLKYPMRRTRPKGDPEPGWQRISWEEALSETASRLSAIRAESGAEAVVFPVTTPSGTPLSDSIDWIERFVRGFGSPNICYATEICNWHKDFAHAFTFGCGIPPADYENADLVVLWGHNPASTWLAQANAIGRGRARGAKLIVVDPRPTALARQADVWLPVRPGTDAALALGILNLMIAAGGFDEDFLRRWTNAPFLVRADDGRFLRDSDVRTDGRPDRYMVWDEDRAEPVAYDPAASALPTAMPYRLRGDVVVRGLAGEIACVPAFELLAREAAAYPAEIVTGITGVSREMLAEAATLYASSRRIAYHAWTGIGQHTNATQAERAVACLYALSGSFDLVGGNRIRRTPPVPAMNGFDLIPPAQRAKALGLAERPIGPPANGWVTARDTYRAILEGEPYRVRAMMAFGTNLPVSQADTELAERALCALEFHVHLDLFETPAARYADILLPVNTPWEREGLRIGFEINDRAASRVQLRPQMVSARDESRSDNDIVFDLACRLGMGDSFFGGSLEAAWDHMLAPLGTSTQELRGKPDGIAIAIDARERKYALAGPNGMPAGFGTETGRVELYSELLLRHGQPPLPTYVESGEGLRQAGSDVFPLVLSSAKNGYYCHSQHRGLVSLRKRAPEPVAEIGTGLAALRGIETGDRIVIRTRIGEARFVARISPGLADDVVVAEYGWWQACPEIDRPELPESGPRTSNYNALISADAVDPISGSIPHRSFPCEVALDPAYEPRQRKWSGSRPFVVSNLTPEAEGVLGIQLTAADGGELPDYRPGQHVETRFAINDATVSRAYSLTGAAEIDGRRHYSVAVRHQRGTAPDGLGYEGLASGHLHRTLRVGDTIALGAPSGSFVLPRSSPEPIVLIAGGIGITPFLSLLESLPDGSEQEIWLYAANQNSRTHAFRERIAAHERRLPGLRVHDHYNRPLPDDAGYSPARLTDSVIGDDLIARRARVYMCGPSAMMDAVRAGLMARGMPAFDIFSEIFRSPPEIKLADNGGFQVTFAQSGRKPVQWTSRDGTLLTFAETLGLQLPSGCRVGQCESCAVTVLAGKVRHLHGTEPDDPNVCLACQAVPVEDVVLDA